MDDNRPTQKDIAGKYAGNPGYFRRSHYLRSLRGWCFALAVVASLFVVGAFHFRGRDEIFTTGPLSERHARLANDCRACHSDAQTDVLKVRLSQTQGGRSMPAMVMAGVTQQGAGNDGKFTAATPPAMDQACLKCHSGFGLHQPQAAALASRSVSTQVPLVHANNCFVCHREHTGHGRMALPDRQTCASCHNDVAALRRAVTSIPVKGTPVSVAGENRDLGDGVIRFVAPARSPDSLRPFTDYAHGHPPFGYEQPGVRDPAELKFNHARHARADVTAMGPNGTLECADCHRPGPRGVFYQPVNHVRHCQQCHTLQILPGLSKLRIPHGDPEKVRYFLASLRVSVDNALRADGVTDPDELKRRSDAEMEALRRRGLNTLDDLEKRVFFEGDPKDEADGRRLRSGNPKFLTECSKCHTVAPGNAEHAPKVQRPTMAERWVQRGPFTHLPHLHMTCADCHGAAATSKLTADILLPPQKLCAECHRPPESNGEPSRKLEEAAAQRSAGGVKWDCQSCHQFHAPPDAEAQVRAISRSAR